MKKLFIGLFVIILIGTGFFFLNLKQKNISSLSTSPTPSQATTPTTISQMDLGAGGSSYLDEKGAYSLLYPNDYILDTQDPIHVRIYKRGETQRPQSEMSDGVIMVFETLDLSGTSLQKLVDTRIKESTADGTTEIVEPKKAVTRNGYPGFHYSLRGLGTAENLILQKSENSKNAVLITYSVDDPKRKGYQKEIDAILTAFKLLK